MKTFIATQINDDYKKISVQEISIIGDYNTVNDIPITVLKQKYLKMFDMEDHTINMEDDEIKDIKELFNSVKTLDELYEFNHDMCEFVYQTFEIFENKQYDDKEIKL